MMEKKQVKYKKGKLRKGEAQRKNGGFDFRWTGEDGKRHSIYAPTLEELRAKEENILKDQCDRIKTEARFVTVNDVFNLWKQLKRGLKDNTFQNYQYMYGMFVAPNFGKCSNNAPQNDEITRLKRLCMCSIRSNSVAICCSFQMVLSHAHVLLRFLLS